MKWRSNFNPDILLSEIKKSRRINNGKVTFLAPPPFWTSTLYSSLDQGGKKSEHQKRRAIDNALFSPLLGENFSPEEYLAALKRAHHEYEKHGKSLYVTAFPLIGSTPNNLPSYIETHLSKTEITQDHPDQNIVEQRDELKGELHDLMKISDEDLSFSTLIFVNSYGFNPRDAFESSERAISVYLGAVNLFRNRTLISHEGESPLHSNTWAPFATVHLPNGDLAERVFWYETWASPRKHHKTKNEDESEYVTKVLSDCQASPWRDRAHEALARYYEAFSKPTKREAFLEGWRLLEFIGGKPNTSLDILISRASKLWADADYQQQIGKHLKSRRNSLTHGRTISNEDDSLVASQLHLFIRPLLMNYIRNPLGAESEDHLWQLLDYPADLHELGKIRDDVARLTELRS